MPDERKIAPYIYRRQTVYLLGATEPFTLTVRQSKIFGNQGIAYITGGKRRTARVRNIGENTWEEYHDYQD